MGDAEEARRLRTEEGLSARQIQERLGASKMKVLDWLRGVPPPAWTARPTAKDDLRAEAVSMRQQGWSVNDIALELGVARSTSWRWVSHLPLDPDAERAVQKRERGRLLLDGRWRAHREARMARRAEVTAEASTIVGALSARDRLLVGAAIYWCEGAKEKPWRAFGQLAFANSDARLILLFLAFLRVLEVPAAAICFRLSIHETGDAEAAVRWWAVVVGVDADNFLRTTIKRHMPRTNRRNTGDDYRGCLTVTVRRSVEHYWRLEGILNAMAAIVEVGVPRDELC